MLIDMMIKFRCYAISFTPLLYFTSLRLPSIGFDTIITLAGATPLFSLRQLIRVLRYFTPLRYADICRAAMITRR